MTMAEVVPAANPITAAKNMKKARLTECHWKCLPRSVDFQEKEKPRVNGWLSRVNWYADVKILNGRPWDELSCCRRWCLRQLVSPGQAKYAEVPPFSAFNLPRICSMLSASESEEKMKGIKHTAHDGGLITEYRYPGNTRTYTNKSAVPGQHQTFKLCARSTYSSFMKTSLRVSRKTKGRKHTALDGGLIKE